MCIRYKGKLVDQYKARFGEAPIKSGGIRLWVVFEQAMQLYEHGVTNVLETAQLVSDEIGRASLTN